MHSKMIIVLSLVAVALAAPTGDNNTMSTPIKNALTQGFEMLDSMIDETISEGIKLDYGTAVRAIFESANSGIQGLSRNFCYDDRPADKVQAYADNLRQKMDKLATDEYDNIRDQPEYFEETNQACKENEYERDEDEANELSDALESLLYAFDAIVMELDDKASSFDCPPEYQPSEAEAKRMIEWTQKYADLVNDFVTEVDSEGKRMFCGEGNVDMLNNIRRKVGKDMRLIKENMPSVASQMEQLRDTIREARDHTENIVDRQSY